jgi:galactoside O-acetyltransferase
MLRQLWVSYQSRAFLHTARRVGSIGQRNHLHCRLGTTAPDCSLTIGNDCDLHCSFTLEGPGARIALGNRVYIGASHLISACAITVEDDVFIAWGVTIIDHNSHPLDFQHRRHDQAWLPNAQPKDWTVVKKQPVCIGARAWIGFHSIILKGVSIGHDAVVGAGAVVTRDVPPGTVVGGNPAIPLLQLPQERTPPGTNA